MKRNKLHVARIQFIDRKIRYGSYPNAKTLAREYEVATRTIRRDIEYMKNSLDSPIEYDSSKKGFYYTEPSFTLPDIQISESELFSLCVAEKALEMYRATPLYEKLSSVFDKLLLGLSDEVKASYSWLNPDITFMQQSHTTIEPEIWELLSGALNTCTVVRISHRKAGAPKTVVRDVEPCHMVSYEGEWYCVAYCRLRKQVLTFAISRIQKAGLVNEQYTRRAGFNINEYLGEHFGITIEGVSHNVEIKFSPDAAPYIRERTWHSNQRISERPDGALVLTFKTNSVREVKRWVLGWGVSAEVLRPESLKQEIISEVKNTLQKYSTV